MTHSSVQSLSVRVDEFESVSALLLTPPAAKALFVFGHGAGAGMTHAFMSDLSRALFEREIGTLRYQFPFMEHGSRRPDVPKVAHAAVRAAVREAWQRMPQFPIFAGGKSFGGRMTSQAQAIEPIPGLRGIVFVGFPLHPADKPSTTRADHLRDVGIPMLFLQGTRDDLAELGLLVPVVEALDRATIRIFDDADHAFHVRKQSGHTDRSTLDALATAMEGWMSET
jgi:predicted alpha/beta-hydrolase family hydrolase